MNLNRIAWTAGIALVVVVAFNHYQAKAGRSGGSVTRLAA